MMKGSEILIKELRRHGVDIVFGYPGASILSLYDEMSRSDIRHILPADERGAVAIGGELGARLGQHPGRSVEADDAAVELRLGQKKEGQTAGAGGYVEHIWRGPTLQPSPQRPGDEGALGVGVELLQVVVAPRGQVTEPDHHPPPQKNPPGEEIGGGALAWSWRHGAENTAGVKSDNGFD